MRRFLFEITPQHLRPERSKSPVALGQADIARQAIGRLGSYDVGKRVYATGAGLYQAENDEQRNMREKEAGRHRDMTAARYRLRLEEIAEDVRESNNVHVCQQLTIAEARNKAAAAAVTGETAYHAARAAEAFLAAVDRHNQDIGGKILDAAERLQVAALVARECE